MIQNQNRNGNIRVFRWSTHINKYDRFRINWFDPGNHRIRVCSFTFFEKKRYRLNIPFFKGISDNPTTTESICITIHYHRDGAFSQLTQKNSSLLEWSTHGFDGNKMCYFSSHWQGVSLYRTRALHQQELMFCLAWLDYNHAGGCGE